MGSAETPDSQSATPGLQSRSSRPVLFRQSSVATRMKPVLALLFTVLSLSLAGGPASDELPADLPDVVKYEMQAFEQCETDGVDGLSWDEVEACEDMFGDQLEELGIALPSEDDFNASDLNGDGTLLFEEWEEWANLP